MKVISEIPKPVYYNGKRGIVYKGYLLFRCADCNTPLECEVEGDKLVIKQSQFNSTWHQYCNALIKGVDE